MFFRLRWRWDRADGVAQSLGQQRGRIRLAARPEGGGCPPVFGSERGRISIFGCAEG